MHKGIGFNRNIYLHWLDATAAFCGESSDPGEIRSRLESVVGQDIASDVNRRKAIDILINIWVKSVDVAPELHKEAVQRYQATTNGQDRLWLHYGLTLLVYPFFREVTGAIGQLSRHQDTITPLMVKQRLVMKRGQLGSLEKAVERIIFSLRDWGILTSSEQRYIYTPRAMPYPPARKTSSSGCWRVRCTPIPRKRSLLLISCTYRNCFRLGSLSLRASYVSAQRSVSNDRG